MAVEGIPDVPGMLSSANRVIGTSWPMCPWGHQRIDLAGRFRAFCRRPREGARIRSSEALSLCCSRLVPVRIESAFIADHAEVNPATRTLDVRSGFQNSIRVPTLPFQHLLALALVVQVAADEYGRAFNLGIDVDRVDELPVMVHQDFSFEIPRGMHVDDGISHHH